MPYRKYKGSDKYHFRYYHLSNNHPFLVVLVLEEKKENGKVLISGFNMTTSIKLYNKRAGKFIKLKSNPDPSNKKQSFIKTDLVKMKPSKLFSDPLVGWHLSDEDIKAVDEMIDKKYPELKKRP